MRRRYSGKMQDWLVGYMCDLKEKGALPGFVGTSNMFLAKKYGNEQNRIKAVGTMAHEFAMCVGQGNRLYNPAFSNKLMLDAWKKSGKKFTIEAARCIGACGLAPAMMVDDDVHKEVSPATLYDILDQYE